METTFKQSLGYKYYVYVSPGFIEYFYTLEAAQKFQLQSGGTIGVVN